MTDANLIGMMKLFLADESDTLKLGEKIAKQFPQGGIVLLYGDLGSGKTTFVRGLLAACGHQGAVKSPTYTLVEPYELQGRTIYHFDLYRLGDPEELEYVGGRDYFDEDALCLIEWPEKAAGFLPKADISIHLRYQGEGREVKIETITS